MFVTSGHSFRHSVGKTDKIIERIKELGYGYAPIADVASTWVFTEWKKEAEKAGLKPIYAVQLAVTPNPKAKKPVIDFWTFVAKDSIQSINKLVENATSQFRYQPLLTYEQATAAEGVFIITGHKAQFDQFKPQDNLFVGLSPACSKGFIKRAIENDHKFVAAQNNCYPRPEDKQFYEIVCGRNANSQTYPQYILSENEWFHTVGFNSIDGLKESSVHNLDIIFGQCTADLPQADIFRPKVDKTLRQMCLEGAERFGIDLSRAGYMERLDHELEVITDKKFEDYFFVVGDLMQFARANMLCGPGRGSSAGSLVCYCLGITNVDPIEHKLLFFRFLDPLRSDWPDIDSDLEDKDRLIPYIEQKYGQEYFAQVGAVGKIKTASALNEACKALGVPRFEADKVEDKVVKYAAFDKKVLTALDDAFKDTLEGQMFLKKYPEMQIAADIVGTPTHATTHAGGILLANEPISKYVALDKRQGGFTAQIDKDEAEKRGLIKIDMLGLDTLAIFGEALKLAGLTIRDLEKLSYDDQAAFDILNHGKFTGTFQFDGQAARNLTKEAKVESLNDIAILSALARPGPLSSGGAGKWVKKRTGRMEVDYPHPALEPYLKETLGELVYQEQIMLIAHEVAGMDWGMVSKLRKAIGKSQGESALTEYGEPFIEGLERAGVPNDIATRFWRDVIGFGSYGFNKSHAIAYGIVSYWSCWLKAHYPLEFAAASLSFRTKVETQIELLRELAAEGVSYTPVDIEHSTDKWRVVNGRLIGPISLVKGCGPKMTQQILSARARGEPMPERAMKLFEAAKTPVDDLFPIRNAIEKIDLTALNILSRPTSCKNAKPNGDWQEDVLVLGCVRLCEERDENDDQRVQDRLARGQTGKYKGQTKFIEIRLFDDSGEIYAKVGRNEYYGLRSKLENVKSDSKTLLCVKGTVCPDAPVLLVKSLKVVGEIE